MEENWFTRNFFLLDLKFVYFSNHEKSVFLTNEEIDGKWNIYGVEVDANKFCECFKFKKINQTSLLLNTFFECTLKKLSEIKLGN